jgi:hypothetical protein
LLSKCHCLWCQNIFAEEMPMHVMPNYFELRLCCLFWIEIIWAHA